MRVKKYNKENVLSASIKRVNRIFDDFENIYISFSGGKDSSVMSHLVLQEARKRNRKVGYLIIDLEAQYEDTIHHIEYMIDEYQDVIDLHWVCVPLLLRNALTNYEPRWTCWDEDKKDIWVREKPPLAKTAEDYPFFVDKMEFEEFMILFGEWYGGDKKTVALVGIRADESLHRYRAITAYKHGSMHDDLHWTSLQEKNLFNAYPIYDWKTEDIWRFHGKYSNLKHNEIYDKMNMAGVKLSQQRLCQPYGDDQRQGLWLYHILEPETWGKVINRVNGANSGALYIRETGNMTGYNKISKPDGHTWESFTNMLLSTLPQKTSEHYKKSFKKFIVSWQDRGYVDIPDEAPHDLEVTQWAPSWKRMAKTILRNDYWCKGLGQSQPKSDAYKRFKDMKSRKELIKKGQE